MTTINALQSQVYSLVQQYLKQPDPLALNALRRWVAVGKVRKHIFDEAFDRAIEDHCLTVSKNNGPSSAVEPANAPIVPTEVSDDDAPLRDLAFNWMRYMQMEPAKELSKICRDWQARDPRHYIEYQRWCCMWTALFAHREERILAGEPTTDIPDLQALTASQLEAVIEEERDSVLAERAAWLSRDHDARPYRIRTTVREVYRDRPEHQAVTLYLNTETEVEVTAELTRRRITLITGEIGVLIGEKLHWPHQVDVDGIQFTSEAGVFDVCRYSRHCIDVTVVDGVVHMRCLPDASLPKSLAYIEQLFIPGYRIRITPEGVVQFPLPHGQAVTVLGWCNGRLYFVDTPLKEVIEKFNRYQTDLLELADTSLAGTLVSGAFPIKNVQVLLDSLCKHFDIQAQRVAHSIYLSRASKSSRGGQD